MIAANPGGPAATLTQKNAELQKLLSAPDADKRKDEQKKILESLLDYDTMARQALAEHWDGLKRRDELIGVFKQMLQQHYLRMLKSHLAGMTNVQNELFDGATEASVTTMIQIRATGKESDEECVFKLRKVGDSWRVRDIVTDEVSLVRNYKTQFHKIINEQGEAKLIEKMKAKL